MTERELESQLIGAAKRRRGLCLKFVSPGANGVPDRIVIMPGGAVGFVEVKAPGAGRLSKLQARWIRKLNAQFSVPAYVLDDPGQVEAVLSGIEAHEIQTA